MTDSQLYTQWLETAPKMIGTRDIDWDHILYHVPAENKIKVSEIVVEELDLFEDGDHQVVFDDNVLRFKTRLHAEYIDLNRMSVDVQLGKIPVEDYNRILRDGGYSLSGYRDARMPTYTKYLTDDDGFYILEFEEEIPKPINENITLFGRIRDDEGLRNDCIPVELSVPFSYKVLYDTLDEVLQPEGKLGLFFVSNDPTGVKIFPLTTDSFEKYKISNGDFIEIKLLPKE